MTASRPQRSTSALHIVKTSTVVPWGTPANPSNLPMPRNDDEWDRATKPCESRQAQRITNAIALYGDALTDSLGDGFTFAYELSDYAADMTLGLIDLHQRLLEARAEQEKRDVLSVAGAHYRARPVQACSNCGLNMPHTYVNDDEAMCLVCGERNPR